MAALSWTASTLSWNYRATNAILKLSQFMTFSATKGEDQSSRVEAQKLCIPFPMRPRPLSILLDGRAQVQIFGRWRLNLIVHVIQQ
jgi:hypothetical protein